VLKNSWKRCGILFIVIMIINIREIGMPCEKRCTPEIVKERPRVNEAYVSQRVLLLQDEWVDGWENELDRINERGRREDPSSFRNHW
jgi:hypothetical protein